MKPRYYITPPATILPDPHECGSRSILSGDSMAQFMSQLTPCRYLTCTPAPQVTTSLFDLLNPFDIAKVSKLAAPLQAVLHTPVTVSTTHPGASFAVIVANEKPDTVPFKRVLMTRAMDQGQGLTAALGVTTDNHPACIDLASMPHTLVAGGSGSGKSVMLNSIITSLLYKHTPADLQMLMIDPKQVELTQYDGIPHLCRPVVTDPAQAVAELDRIAAEMERRYKIMRKRRRVSAEGLFPRLLIVIDELADLMLLSKKAAETSISRIAYKGRAAGIHLLIATQRPTVNVVSGAIKANIQCRICLKVASTRDSINIIDRKGGEALLGKGDALLQLPTQPDPIRIQGAWITPEDIRRTVEYWTKS